MAFLAGNDVDVRVVFAGIFKDQRIRTRLQTSLDGIVAVDGN